MSANFKYKGIQENKYIDGEISAVNRDEAVFKLKEQKIIVTSLEKVSGKEETKKKLKKTKKKVKLSKKIRIIQVITFTKKLETMVRAGLPILETIQMLEKQTIHPSFKVIIGKISNDVESGTTLSDAFEKYPFAFNNIYVNLLRAGESSGKVDLFLKKRLQIEEKYKKSLKDVNGIQFQKQNLKNRKRVVWFVNILVDKNRDLYLNEMKNINIESRPFFYSLSMMPLYSSYSFSSKISKKVSSLGLTLPTHDMVNDHIIDCIAHLFKK